MFVELEVRLLLERSPSWHRRPCRGFYHDGLRGAMDRSYPARIKPFMEHRFPYELPDAGSAVVLFFVRRPSEASAQTRRGIRMADKTAKWIISLDLKCTSSLTLAYRKARVPVHQ